MIKQPPPFSKPPEFDETAFIKDAEAKQKKLLSDVRLYLFDLKGYIKGLKGNMADSIAQSADFLDSAITWAENGYVPDTKDFLGSAKRFNHDIPENIIGSLMDAARIGGMRNFVKYLHVVNP